VETCDDSITIENEELKEEVKKLEKGSTNACVKLHLQGHKSNNGKVKGQARSVQFVQHVAIVLKAMRVQECGSAASQCGGAAPRQNRKVPKVTKVQCQPKKTLITCFKCKKEGHHVRDCALNK
jgi:hypothetical protein